MDAFVIKGLARGWVALALVTAFSLAASAAGAAERVRIGLLKLSSAAPLFLAKERGYFEQEGIDADLKFFDAAVPIAVPRSPATSISASPASPLPSTTSRARAA